MSEPPYQYDGRFFDYVDRSARRSAEVAVPVIAAVLQPRSVLDVGCGRGIWCAVWREAGTADVFGVDGAYVDPETLVIPRQRFRAHDITQPFDLGRRFDLVLSLEVGEHLPEADAEPFVDNLTRHAPLVLFSSAVPGQGGEFHVNEQPLDYWRAKFKSRGYRCFDPLRPRILHERQVEPWYRYNMLLYATDEAAAALPEEVRSSEIEAGEPVPERAPLSWRTRKAVLRAMPAPAIHRLAQLKHAVATGR